MNMQVNTETIGKGCTISGFDKMPLFRGVDLGPLMSLLGRCDVAVFEAEDLLLDPSMGNLFCYLILGGSVSIYLDNLQGTPIAMLSVGECVGEMSMFDGKNPSAFVKANDKVKVLVMDSSTLWEMINVSHGFARNLLYLLSKRVRLGNGVATNSLQQQEEHKKAANSDALTGLHNRRWLEERIERLNGRTLSDLAPLSVMMLDVDHFKRFNDRYGHQLGDEVLVNVASVIQERLRPSDMVGRYGGEEFIVLLPKSTVEVAERIAERLREGVELLSIRSPMLSDKNRSIAQVTISIGIAQWDGSQLINELIAGADAALYQAKAQGRNQYCCAQSIEAP